MKVAVPCVEKDVFQHYGHCPRFLLFEVDSKHIMRVYELSTDGESCQTLAQRLQRERVATVLCGGIGAGAKKKLLDAGIQVCAGVNGDAKEQVQNWLDGTLVYDENKTCDHHDGEHECHGEGHGCTK